MPGSENSAINFRIIVLSRQIIKLEYSVSYNFLRKLEIRPNFYYPVWPK